jgi:hypothetical protein
MRTLANIVSSSLVAAAFAVAAVACGPTAERNGPAAELDGDGGTGVNDAGESLVDAAPTCFNLQCQQVSCPGGGTTRLSGTVYTPKGDLPLPNVTVYVPNAAVQPLPEGVICERCDELITGSPLVRTATDVEGRFYLDNMPVGQNIPVVIQSGKWRREITIPTIDECVDNPVADPDLTRLPRNKAEGNIPRIALTTGGADALECLLRKIGIADSEFTREEGDGRVNFYAGRSGASRFNASLGGQNFTAASTFWNSLDNLATYDVVLHSCEGLNDDNNKSAEAKQALYDYTAMGGRVFMSHYHNWWLRDGPEPWPTMAVPNWTNWCCHSDARTVRLNTSFDKALQMAEWLQFTGASTTLGYISVINPRGTVPALDESLAELWATSLLPEYVQYFAFNTPLSEPEEDRCGRVVFSDLHVSGGQGRDTPGAQFPNGCTTTDLIAQEKALIYMFFDITGCIAPPLL